MSIPNHVVRFDTIAFNPETNILQVWRYREGLYPGNHELVSSIETNAIKSDTDFRAVMSIIMMVVGLHGFSQEFALPLPWQGYRFI